MRKSNDIVDQGVAYCTVIYGEIMNTLGTYLDNIVVELYDKEKTISLWNNLSIGELIT